MTYNDAMNNYGNDKPDIRFGMQIKELTSILKGKGFPVFDSADYIGGICAPAVNEGFYSNKFGNDIRDFARNPQIGAESFVYGRYQPNGNLLTSIDKFLNDSDKESLTKIFNARPGECLLIVGGSKKKSLRALSEIRLEMAKNLQLCKKDIFAPLWVIDFPLLEWDEETNRFYAMHHPFTSPKPEHIALLDSDPKNVNANAYDMVINGVEVGGGSIRIHDQKLQQKMFKTLGFTAEEAENQFGFLMNAFRFGAPPHGGIAFGFDRLVSLFAGLDSIRDVIAFPKNNSGRDLMIDTPSEIKMDQLKELSLKVVNENN
jgi:aspartyl-tRNA synthetase